jgi:dTDP-4-amino-4,6-dideoxygalactose transaminase
VLTVDVFGLPANYPAIEPLLAERGATLICDAACSLGGAIGARRTGAFGAMSCLSFHPRKSLTTGEGGMVMTDDEGLAQRLRRLRNHGTERQGWRATFVEPGYNYRLSDINAALGLAQVPGFPAAIARRRELAAALSERLREIDGIEPQAEPDGFTHPYQAYVVACAEGLDRDALIFALRERGIESTLGTYAMHAEPSFQRACGTRPGALPISHALAERSLALPLHHRMRDGDVDLLADTLGTLVSAQRAMR